MRKMVPYKTISIIIISSLIIPIFSLSSDSIESSNKSNFNILFVSKTGSTYSSIKDALDDEK